MRSLYVLQAEEKNSVCPDYLQFDCRGPMNLPQSGEVIAAISLTGG